jgi:DNA-binding FadR family transcriptional regulator
VIDSGDDPAYVRVARMLESWIRAREPGYGPGWVLPTEDRLARELGLGRRTVGAAYRLLANMGVLTIRSGYGATVRAEPQREIITVPPGTVVHARMPTFAELDEWQLDPGTPVLVVGEAVYPADRFEIRSDDPEG